MLTVVSDSADRDGSAATPPAASSLIDEIVREGARRMLAEALQAEVDAYIAQFADVRDENGHRLVVRNGCHSRARCSPARASVPVTAPRVNDKRVDPETGERQRFSSAILPPWARKTPKIGEVLPLLYLHGLSQRGFRARARAVPRLGQGAVVLDDHQAHRDLEGRGARVRRAGPVGRGLRVPLGGRDPRQRAPRGGQAVPAGDDRGARRRPQGAHRSDRRLPRGRRVVGGSAARLPNAAACGPRCSPTGDGALGFWGALREVFPETREQRCWFHKISNVLAALPKSAHPGREEGARRDLERRGQVAMPWTR